jgi:hypothetical protein
VTSLAAVSECACIFSFEAHSIGFPESFDWAADPRFRDIWLPCFGRSCKYANTRRRGSRGPDLSRSVIVFWSGAFWIRSLLTCQIVNRISFFFLPLLLAWRATAVSRCEPSPRAWDRVQEWILEVRYMATPIGGAHRSRAMNTE